MTPEAAAEAAMLKLIDRNPEAAERFIHLYELGFFYDCEVPEQVERIIRKTNGDELYEALYGKTE